MTTYIAIALFLVIFLYPITYCLLVLTVFPCMAMSIMVDKIRFALKKEKKKDPIWYFPETKCFKRY